VFSTVVLKDRNNPIEVNYLMRRDGNDWKIYDITLDAISVIANYRNQFNRVLNDGGYDKLVSILRAKQQALGASLAH
jgi:phospholipid transport system substrate-binding protein